MKRIIACFLLIAMMSTLAACGKAPETAPIEPEISQMKAICELAVMECYYHNVAKFLEEDAEKGFLGIGKKDKHFWIEYSGVVKLGVDVSQVNVEIEDTVVTITIPKAKVLNCEVDDKTLSKDSFIVDQDSADITAEDEIAAFASAQMQMEETAANDTALLANAQQRAQDLLEGYIKNIGSAVGKEYTVKWIYLEDKDTPVPAETDSNP